MTTAALQWIDVWGRKHPWLLLALVLSLTALVSVPALLFQSQGATVLYQSF